MFISASSLTQSRESRWKQRARRAMANQCAGKAASEIPALKPYRGKPAVRNFRGDGGNAGIIEARLAPPSYSTITSAFLPCSRFGCPDRSKWPYVLVQCGRTKRLYPVLVQVGVVRNRTKLLTSSTGCFIFPSNETKTASAAFEAAAQQNPTRPRSISERSHPEIGANIHFAIQSLGP